MLLWADMKPVIFIAILAVGPLLGHFTADAALTKVSCAIESSEHDTDRVTAARHEVPRAAQVPVASALCARPS